MNDRVIIDRPIQIADNTVERVAYDLMCRVANAEDGNQKQESNPRDYYLELYYQCLKTVRGNDFYIPKNR